MVASRYNRWTYRPISLFHPILYHDAGIRTSAAKGPRPGGHHRAGGPVRDPVPPAGLRVAGAGDRVPAAERTGGGGDLRTFGRGDGRQSDSGEDSEAAAGADAVAGAIGCQDG